MKQSGRLREDIREALTLTLSADVRTAQMNRYNRWKRVQQSRTSRTHAFQNSTWEPGDSGPQEATLSQPPCTTVLRRPRGPWRSARGTRYKTARRRPWGGVSPRDPTGAPVASIRGALYEPGRRITDGQVCRIPGKRHSDRIVVVVSTTTTDGDGELLFAPRESRPVWNARGPGERDRGQIRAGMRRDRTGRICYRFVCRRAPLRFTWRSNETSGGARNPDAFTQGSIQHDVASQFPGTREN